MKTQIQPGIVADPVANISISGVHGIEEINERLSRTPARAWPRPVLLLSAGAVLGTMCGAMLTYFLRR